MGIQEKPCEVCDIPVTLKKPTRKGVFCGTHRHVVRSETHRMRHAVRRREGAQIFKSKKPGGNSLII